ncbi:AAA-domain-containing protein [Rhizoclosmatium globosum]|uniref:AAA-domain-containing protein n=1 Tax=Rhizoclosmatium globosum TaxID=329046 RepID=A0A1Y2CTW9_9FUNG|nr:AAA-domain-containing protein [Rhizoclosmatium globosum]|eukprot:ORY49785.1 AAA-domain-containing protein [Rhizoclosmatium globosum]
MSGVRRGEGPYSGEFVFWWERWDFGRWERCKGVLLYGPPGTGKTMLAKAVATECKANFLAVSVAGIVKGLIGESEKQIANLFAQAKATSPCIIFLDEIESVFASRESSGDFSQKILAQLVQEMDALGVSKENEDAPQVVVLAATNYPALMDATLLRPGRIDRLIAVRAPNLSQRASIFRVYASKTPCRDGIDWTEWARRVKGLLVLVFQSCSVKPVGCVGALWWGRNVSSATRI